MAPEVFLSHYNSYMITEEGEIRGQLHMFQGEKADIYSLGIILFTMFFGNLPFQNVNLEDPFFRLLSSGD